MYPTFVWKPRRCAQRRLPSMAGSAARAVSLIGPDRTRPPRVRCVLHAVTEMCSPPHMPPRILVTCKQGKRWRTRRQASAETSNTTEQKICTQPERTFNVTRDCFPGPLSPYFCIWSRPLPFMPNPDWRSRYYRQATSMVLPDRALAYGSTWLMPLPTPLSCSPTRSRQA